MPDWFSQNAPTQPASAAAPPAQTSAAKGNWFDLYSPDRKPAATEDFYQAPRDVSVGNMLWSAAKSLNPVPALQAMADDQRPEDWLLGPGKALGPLLRAARTGIQSEAEKAATAARQGRGWEAAGHAAATFVPLVGPAAASAGEDIGSGDPERIERGGGNAIGLVGSMLAPAAAAKVAPKVAPALATMGEQLASKGQAIKTAAGKVNPIVLDVASEVAGHALGASLGVPTLARRVLGHVLDSARKPAASNAGGRLVSGAKTASVESELADALAEVRAETPSARVSTPPEPSLPPGYTPRSTVPRPRLVKPQAAREATQASPGEPAPVTAARAKRAYFLKSPEDIAAAEIAPEAVAPTGSIDIADLPAAWKSHTGQDLFPVTGVEAKEITAALRAEIKERGMTVGQAISAVSKNKDIPTKMRAQIIRSFTASAK
jgi:hypothetical protein